MDRQWEELKVENIHGDKDKPYEVGEDIEDFLETFECQVKHEQPTTVYM